MRKIIAFILAFVFTLQVSATSFAQSNSGAELQALHLCINKFTENGKMFQTDVGLGEKWNSLNLTKGFVLSSFIPNLSEEQKLGFAAFVFGMSGLVLTISVVANHDRKLHLDASQFRTRVLRQWAGGIPIALALIGIAIRYYQISNEDDSVLNNESEISVDSIAKADTTLAIDQILSSDSASAAQLRSDSLKACQESLKFVNQNESIPQIDRRPE